MIKTIILPLALVVSACAIREANLKAFDNQRPATDTERTAVLQSIRKQLFDPFSIRDAAISNAVPTYGHINICVLANAKNRMGAYIGRQPTHYLFDASGTMTVATYGDFCNNERIAYQPFPEAEHIGRAPIQDRR